GYLDRAPGHPDAGTRVAEEREGRRRLPAARFANEAEDLPLRDRERDAVDDGLAAPELDSQAADGERLRPRRQRTAPTSTRPSVRATASPTRFAAIVSSAISSAGTRIT